MELRVIQGDNREVLKNLTNYQFDLIYADPPNPHASESFNYGDYFFDWFNLCWPLLKESGSLLMSTTKNNIIPFIKEMDILPQDIWTYDKRGMGLPPVMKGSLRYHTEWVIDWHKSKDRYINYDFLPIDIIAAKTNGIRPAKWHKTPKNLAFMKKIVQGLCPPDGLVLDPFLGSGTTLVACKQTGRNGIGIELNEEWAELCKERISKTIRQPNISDFLEERIGVKNGN